MADACWITGVLFRAESGGFGLGVKCPPGANAEHVSAVANALVSLAPFAPDVRTPRSGMCPASCPQSQSLDPERTR